MANDIKKVRDELGLSQREFSKLIGYLKPTIERWETSKNNWPNSITIVFYRK